MTPSPCPVPPSLKAYLDVLLASTDAGRHVARDPVRFVVRCSDPADAEVVAFVASALAYGAVDRILRDVADLLGRMGPHPARFVRDFDPRGASERRVFEGFLHRMTGALEMRALCHALGTVLREDGDIETRFVRHDDPTAITIRDGLEALVTGLRRDMEGVVREGVDEEEARRRVRRIKFLLPRPSEGSACKRLNLALRWLVRCEGGVDLGLWSRVRPARLLLPLDTHTARLSRSLGLTTRTTADWRMAEEVTATLRTLDPDDPVKYDFALCHLGISGECLHRWEASTCSRCLVAPACCLRPEDEEGPAPVDRLASDPPSRSRRIPGPRRGSRSAPSGL